MDENLKQRLVGALVLMSAAVIFLPLVLDGRDQEEAYSDIQIPEEPVVTLDVTEPEVDIQHFENVKKKIEQDRAAIEPSEEQLNQSLAESATESKPAKIEASKPEPIKPEAPMQAVKKVVETVKKESKQDLKGLDRLSEAYAVQLAAFSSKENAEKLHKKLINKKYAAYIQKGSSKGKTLYRVFVGPELRKNRALMIADALRKEYQLKGMVVRYAP